MRGVVDEYDARMVGTAIMDWLARSPSDNSKDAPGACASCDASTLTSSAQSADCLYCAGLPLRIPGLLLVLAPSDRAVKMPGAML